MNKRGISAVEMLMSFAIFLGVVISMFVYLQPIREPQLNSLLFGIIEQKLQEETEIVLTVLPFKMVGFPGVSQVAGCFWFESPFDLITEETTLIKDKGMNSIDFSIRDRTESGVSFKAIFVGSGKKEFYYIITSSEEISNIQYSPPPSCLKADVKFSVPRIEEALSFVKISELLAKEYENDEGNEGIKVDWKFPRSNDFNIKLGEIGIGKEPPENVNVFSKVVRKDVFENGEIVKRDVMIKVW